MRLPLSTGEPLRAWWPAASLSGTGTIVQQTANPFSGLWTQLQRSSVPLFPPSWIFSMHDAPVTLPVSWSTPPIPPTVSSSSYHQEDGSGASEPAPPDCSTAFSPRLWEPWTQIPPPLSETLYKPSTSWNMDHITEKHCLQLFLCDSKCATHRWVGLYKPPVVTLPLFTLDTFQTLLCVHNPTKDSIVYVCLHAHALQITLHSSPASCLTYNVSLCTCTVFIWSIPTVCIVFFFFFVYV